MGPSSMLGAVLLLALAIQVGSGALLLLHYTPDPERAFGSVQTIMWDVPFGWLVRLVHVHGASLAIALALVHLGFVAVRGAYKPPRELVWMSGCVLLLLLVAAAVTGYVLPWSQLSYWAVTITTSAVGEIPWLGELLVRVLRGEESVGAAALRRAFGAHVVVIPLLLLGLLATHVLCVARAGLAGLPERRGGEPPALGRRAGSLGLDYALWATALLLALSTLVFFAPKLGVPSAAFEPADPLTTPLDLTTEWYVLWAHTLLRILPAWLALLLQALLVLGLTALPFLDRGPSRRPADRPWVIAALAGLAAGLALLTLVGALA